MLKVDSALIGRLVVRNDSTPSPAQHSSTFRTPPAARLGPHGPCISDRASFLEILNAFLHTWHSTRCSRVSSASGTRSQSWAPFAGAS